MLSMPQGPLIRSTIMPCADLQCRYWAGSLAIHNLDGYGVDSFLQIPKMGNKNEQLTTRASMDSV